MLSCREENQAGTLASPEERYQEPKQRSWVPQTPSRYPKGFWSKPCHRHIYIRFAAINNRCLAVTYTDDTHLVSVITLWIAHLGEFTLPNSMIGVVYVPIVINIVDKHLTGSVAIKHRRYLFCQTPFTSLSKTCSFS